MIDSSGMGDFKKTKFFFPCFQGGRKEGQSVPLASGSSLFVSFFLLLNLFFFSFFSSSFIETELTYSSVYFGGGRGEEFDFMYLFLTGGTGD